MFLKSLTLRGFKSFADKTDARVRARRDRRGGPERLGQVEPRRRGGVGARRPGAAHAARRQDGRRHLRRHPRPPRARAGPRCRSRSTTPPALLPIEFTEVTITRTLFRTGDSEYQINGAPCRLLDIQELLSDTGIGRQQHVIVGQGQLDAVLNARPEDRRGDHRGGGRHPEVPQAARAGRAPARVHRGQPAAAQRPPARGAPAAHAAATSGRRGRAATAGSSRSCARSGCTSPGHEIAGLQARIERLRDARAEHRAARAEMRGPAPRARRRGARRRALASP